MFVLVFLFVFCFFPCLRKPIPVLTFTSLDITTLDVMMSPDIGRNNIFLLIADRVHTVGFKQSLIF